MQIPEFEILGQIGGGSYGEVFLARSVTGSLRAVKVVRREDFERERTFEREFEGIQRYEKVSQNHPGLVDVLHVGRNNDEGYYYYVMELADDVESGHEIDVDDYRPRTLSSDLRQHRLRSVEECIAVGAPLAEALGHLHAAGLTHRDVKPSNIIFVKGVAKLADVGLVASSGQRTFVGTEGYVPPEGPGTSSADLYSLAMVLYEMGTGKDRLEFPELPTNMELPPTVNRDDWRALNAVICRAGAPDARRRYESGEVLANALRGILEPTKVRRGSLQRRVLVAAAILLLATLGAFGYSAYQKQQGLPEPLAPTNPGPTEPSPLAGETGDPVSNSNGTSVANGPGSDGAGSSMSLSSSGDDPGNGENGGPFVGTTANRLPNAFEIGSSRPAFGSASSSGGSVSDGTMIPGNGNIVISDPPIGPPPPPAEPQEPPPPPKAWLRITQPPGVAVWKGETHLADTPTDYIEFSPGKVTLVLRAPGFHDYEFSRELEPNKRLIEGDLQMIPDRAPVEGDAWTNSLGLDFMALGPRHISKDPIGRTPFLAFLEATNYPIDPASLRNLPNDGLALNDENAVWAFCDWMTQRDRDEGFLGPDRFHHPQRDAGTSLAFFSRIEDKFGGIQLNSTPSGASVYRGTNYLGRTPLTLEDQRIGNVRMTLKKPGYRATDVDLEVHAADLTPETITLTRDDSVLFTERWTNGLAMPFVPVRNFMAAVFETRIEDFQAFLDTSPEGVEPPRVGFKQGPAHPVAGVNLNEAKAFCAWLTEKERSEGLIQDYHEYRIPQDLQWSAMAGLDRETGNTPEQRDIQKDKKEYPWGEAWPPPAGSGNFADAAATGTLRGRIIKGYDDSFEKTSPVGSFTPNPYEIHDLAGNVWEWIDSPYGGPQNPSYFFVRGGGYSSSQPNELLSGYRLALRSEFKGNGGALNGFRCVLVDTRITP